MRRVGFEPNQSGSLSSFVGRTEEIKALERLVLAKADSALPATYFYGVGGEGESWLLRHFREYLRAEPAFSEMPTAFIDFEPAYEGYLKNDPTLALYSIREELVDKAPQFDLAYSIFRYKRHETQRPELRGDGTVAAVFDLVLELGKTALEVMALPPLNSAADVLRWFAGHLGESAAKKFEKSPAGQRFLSAAGLTDYAELARLEAGAIAAQLPKRLATDIDEALQGTRRNFACKAVVFIDSYEQLDIGLPRSTSYDHDSWLRTLCVEAGGNVLFILAGQSLLDWPHADERWRHGENLVQHALKGLTDDEARMRLAHDSISVQPELQQAVLRSCREESNTIHPMTLEMCIGIIALELRDGRIPDPISFSFRARDWSALAERFLRALSSDQDRLWVQQLALTPRFDANAAFALPKDAALSPVDEARWTEFRDYPFAVPLKAGWYTIRSQMQRALRTVYQERVDNATWLAAQLWWGNYWFSRSQRYTDENIALVFYHVWTGDPEEGLFFWNSFLAKPAENNNADWKRHLVTFWDLTDLEHQKPRHVTDARALIRLGYGILETASELPSAWQEELRRALACFERASRGFPEDTHAGERVMALIYAGSTCSVMRDYLPFLDTDASAHLKKSVLLLKEALGAAEASGLAGEKAWAERNLGETYLIFAGVGRNDLYLNDAITCFENALQYFTVEKDIANWSEIRRRIGNVYSLLNGTTETHYIERAVNEYRTTLGVVNRDSDPITWARLQRD
jgi:hypothetical protein